MGGEIPLSARRICNEPILCLIDDDRHAGLERHLTPLGVGIGITELPDGFPVFGANETHSILLHRNENALCDDGLVEVGRDTDVEYHLRKPRIRHKFILGDLDLIQPLFLVVDIDGVAVVVDLVLVLDQFNVEDLDVFDRLKIAHHHCHQLFIGDVLRAVDEVFIELIHSGIWVLMNVV